MEIWTKNVFTLWWFVWWSLDLWWWCRVRDGAMTRRQCRTWSRWRIFNWKEINQIWNQSNVILTRKNFQKLGVADSDKNLKNSQHFYSYGMVLKKCRHFWGSLFLPQIFFSFPPPPFFLTGYVSSRSVGGASRPRNSPTILLNSTQRLGGHRTRRIWGMVPAPSEKNAERP